MMAKIMLKKGFKPGDGLGKYGQGIQKTLKIPKNDENFRLRYKSTIVDKIRVANKKRRKRMAHLESQ